ncbi:MAG: DUF4097 family beta strand repeat-containing protein [Acidobacteriaceae bacterium]
MTKQRHNSARRTALIGARAALLLLGFAVAAQAQAPPQSRVYREGGYWVEETNGDMAAAHAVRVRADLGSISVTGPGSGEMRYIEGAGPGAVRYTVRKRVSANSEEQARQLFDSYHFSASRSEGQLVFTGDVPSREWRRGSVQIAIVSASQLSDVKVSTRGGDINVSHIKGRAEIETGGGRVETDDIGENVNISSGGGNVHIGTVKGAVEMRSGGGNVEMANAGGNALVRTGGGNVNIDTVHGDLVVETGAGNLNVKTVHGGIKASTGGGSLDLGDIGGQVAAETGGGSIRLRSGGGVVAETGAGLIQCYNVKRGMKASTGSGGITVEFVGKRSDFTSSHLEAGVGDIVVYLPSDLGVKVDANIDFANGHGIQSDFSGLRITQSSGFGPGQVSAEGNLNGGGPTLELHTTTGNIMIRRARQQ